MAVSFLAAAQRDHVYYQELSEHYRSVRVYLAHVLTHICFEAAPAGRPLGQGGLDVEVAPGHLLPDLIHAVLQAVAPGDDDAIAVKVLRRGQFGADTQQRRQRRSGKDAIPMPIDGWG
jgi:hypothetical protein